MSERLFAETLDIKKYSFEKESIQDLAKNVWIKNLWPIIYIISSDRLGEAYVGESTNAISRMQNHLSNSDRAKLNTLHVITCDKFNKSAALDIESSLIKYISADQKFKLQNGNAGLILHNYYQQKLYTELFDKIWKELKKENLTLNTLKEIDNSDLFKYSPYKSLTVDQHDAVLNLMRLLLQRESNTIFIEGRAGTGKTLLAIYLMKLVKSDLKDFEDAELETNGIKEIELIKSLKQKYPNPQIALVVPQTSLRTTLKKVFRNIKGLSANMVIGPSDVFREKYDILIVDEAHRLKRRLGIVNFGSFDENNRRLGLGEAGTELDWILSQSKNQILFYDEMQSIKPSDIRKEVFVSVKKERKSPVIELKSQLRVKGGTDYINYVDNLLHVNFRDSDEIFQNEYYEFLLFKSLDSLKNKIDEKDKKFGLSRLVAGYSWEWKSKTSNEHDIKIDGLKLKWNSEPLDWINSENALSEVGCIHTTQGYDLNYTGIIFGHEISYDPKTKKILIDKNKYHDKKGKVGITDIEDLKTYIINIYKTLMFRGIKGTYVYVCDKNLRTYFEKHIKEYKE